MADPNNAQPPGGFEDQVRRMFISGPSSEPPSQHPTVRLPPSGPGHYQQQQQGPNLASGYGLNHGQQDGTAGPLMGLPPGGHPKYPANQRLNQQQRRAQQQVQYAPPHPSYGGRPPTMPSHPHPQHGRQQIDPNAYSRGGQVMGHYQQPQGPSRQLFNPNMARGPAMQQQQVSHSQQQQRQQQYLEQLASVEIAKVSMSPAEYSEKEAFRTSLEKVIHEVCASAPDRLPSVSLEPFGSFKSGFANAGSDMDLVIVLQSSPSEAATFGLLEDDLPRALEKRLLQLGYGARLLTRTRVPIIKICEKPDSCLLDKLRQERERWDVLPNEKKYPHLHEDDDEEAAAKGATKAAETAPEPAPEDTGPTTEAPLGPADIAAVEASKHDSASVVQGVKADPLVHASATNQVNGGTTATSHINGVANTIQQQPRPYQKAWTRERKAGPLDFPKSGIGIQSDINFFNPLGLHNTQLLRCYSLCDPRVQPMVLFVKSWAKRRLINSSYSGTLSSYGYVLMVLHYLTNVAQPAVLPNLQGPWRPGPQFTPPGASRTECDGWVVDFWRNEGEITQAVQTGQMSSNRESLGSLLAGFFNYYSSQGYGPQFHWMQEVLSLRSPGGTLSKTEKGWVKAVTEEGEGKKVQHRYLFCIEDPFELSHNVARTVTHNGIVAIRDEFRRAKRILMAVGYGQHSTDGELFDQLVEADPELEAPRTIAEVDGAVDSASVRPAAKSGPPQRVNENRMRDQQRSQQRFNNRGGGPIAGGQGPRPRQAPPAPKPLDTTDEEAFPALGAAKSKRQPAGSNYSEISGDRVKAIVEEAKRKKAEAHAEHTATGAAEAVLNDD